MAGKQITLVDDRDWPQAGFGFELPIRPESCALGVIDVQHYALDSEGHLAHTVKSSGSPVFNDFSLQAERMVANIQQLLAAFQGAGPAGSVHAPWRFPAGWLQT